jgi:hypothetical protein
MLLRTGIFFIFVLTPLAGLAQENPGSSVHSRLIDQYETRGLVSSKGQRISAELAKLHTEYVERVQSSLQFFSPSNKQLRLMNDHVLIEAIALNDKDELQEDIYRLGGIHLASTGYLVSGFVPIAAIRDLESLSSLQSARPSYPFTRTGLVTSQGDAATRADIARNLYGIDGSGVVVGTMSDSFDCLGGAAGDIANDDLPVASTVVLELPGCGGSDEGRAMMQIIHDLAPGAEQMFYTAFLGRPAFADGVRALADLGADIIVDDIGYLDAPFFQDGPVAQAVDAVTIEDGVTYFSAAGNDGDESYESTFTPDSVEASWHDFDPGAGEDLFQRVFLGANASVLVSLQWNEPYASVSGPPGASTDIDICITDEPFSELLACAEVDNVGGDPIEILSFDNGPDAGFYNIVIRRFSGEGTPVLKYVATDTGFIDEFDTGSSTIYGHPNATWAEATGAVNFNNTPVFGTSPPVRAPYSSLGGTPIFFDTNGDPITPEVRNKPNISCVDGANTTFFGFDADIDPDADPNFFGTSAAAPHAAALAALLKQFDPGLAPLDVFVAMENGAIDMDVPGFDFRTGAGLCDVTSTLGDLEMPDIALSVTPSPGSLPEPGGDVTFQVTVNNVGSIDLTLTELSDDLLGNLNGEGTCSLPQTLVSTIGGYQCEYVAAANGNAGDEISVTVTATALGPQNSDTEIVSPSVTITDVLPSAVLTVSITPDELLDPGGPATVNITVENTGSAEQITLSALTDSSIGSLDGQRTCSVPQSIATGAFYECQYASEFAGTEGDRLIRQIDATVTDDEVNELDISDRARVKIINQFTIFRNSFDR